MVDRLVYYFSRQGINKDICQAVKSPLHTASPPWACLFFFVPGSRTLDWVGPLHREVDRPKLEGCRLVGFALKKSSTVGDPFLKSLSCPASPLELEAS